MYDSTLKSNVFYLTSFNQAGGGQFSVKGAKPVTGQLIELDYLHNKAQSWPIPAGIGSWDIMKGTGWKDLYGILSQGGNDVL